LVCKSQLSFNITYKIEWQASGTYSGPSTAQGRDLALYMVNTSKDIMKEGDNIAFNDILIQF
jgi:hypothetical protein